MLTTPPPLSWRLDAVGTLALDEFGEPVFAALGRGLGFGAGELDLLLGDLGVRGERRELAADLRLDLGDAVMEFVDADDFGRG